MSTRLIAIILIILLLLLILWDRPYAHAEPPVPLVPVHTANPPDPVFPPQENPDQFMYQGTSLDKYNKFSEALRQNPTWYWRWEKKPECLGDLKPRHLDALEDLARNFPIRFIEQPLIGPGSPYTHLVRQSCGNELVSKCGAENVNCLPDSYPYNMTIYLASVNTTYQIISAIAVSIHEMFHALCTWNEQYRLDGQFSSSSDLTVMNTGPLSRHLIGQLERDRWNRTCGTREVKETGQGDFGPDYQYVFFCGGVPERATRVVVLYSDDGGRTNYWSGLVAEPGTDSNGCRGVQVWTITGRIVLLKAENAVSWQTGLTEKIAGRY